MFTHRPPAAKTATKTPIPRSTTTGSESSIPASDSSAAKNLEPQTVEISQTVNYSPEALLSENEKQLLYGREKLTKAQKIFISAVCVAVMGLLLGSGIWLYFFVSRASRQSSVNNQNTFIAPDTNADTDGDDLRDVDESKWRTDPTNPDTDGDGYKDGEEVRHGYSPLEE